MNMFRSLDIRGRYAIEITETNFTRLGAALPPGFNPLIAGSDYRPHNSELLKALAAGYGQPIQYVGNAPSPAIAFLSPHNGMALTASHNPANYNGVKFFQQQTYVSESFMEALRSRYGQIATPTVHPPRIENDMDRLKEYEKRLPSFQQGIYDLAGGAVCRMKHLFPHALFSEPDPLFEKHDPEPKNETLQMLKGATRSKNQVGFAFDGDGDRVMLVDQGHVIEGDITAAFIAKHLLSKNDRVVLSIDCRQEVFEMLKKENRTVITSKVGDANVLRLARKHRAIFSAERSGHYSFLTHAPNSDGLYAAARLSDTRPGELATFAQTFRNVTLKKEVKGRYDFQAMREKLEKNVIELNTLDGLKAVFDEFTVLIRASTTETKVRINCEAPNAEQAKKGMAFALRIVTATKRKE
ncbi:hypothetical protein KJ765_03505 [Candidatus Micrarchaeota archaeon]|nr:hypothetical protein [Candidatus Micrarchaeota archaeon]